MYLERDTETQGEHQKNMQRLSKKTEPMQILNRRSNRGTVSLPDERCRQKQFGNAQRALQAVTVPKKKTWQPVEQTEVEVLAIAYITLVHPRAPIHIRRTAASFRECQSDDGALEDPHAALHRSRCFETVKVQVLEYLLRRTEHHQGTQTERSSSVEDLKKSTKKLPFT